ncbi:centrosomal protein of 162 kDa-like [Nilaparvata lugens]|uniref:centrosomal protein of 162 kDa-like n=1 Tax=Nilaparvata lugens TaxID=108931 RepID=UPI00193CFB14|nr:centrosomal protein of 162 kDa-like [Nilaparvata lugens]
MKAKKTSTPERETNETLQCDLSMISPLDLSVSSNNIATGAAGVSEATRDTKSSLARTKSLDCLPTIAESKHKPASRRDDTCRPTEDDLAAAVSNANLRSKLMKYLVEKCTEHMQKNLDEDLYRLQKEIEKEQERENELKYRLKTIQMNKEIEKMLDTNGRNIENLVENLKARNAAENFKLKCDAIAKELEKNKDRIICTNINIPENDESNEKLQLIIGETREAYEDLTSELAKQQIDEKVVEALGKTLQVTEEFAGRQKRCEEGLKQLKTLTARENTLRTMVAIEEKMNKKWKNGFL